MLIDSRGLPDKATIEGGICIIGGGPAGIALATRIAERSSRRVILLESGGEAFDQRLQDLARGETEGLAYYPLDETRIRMLGGTTQSWGGVCAPLDSTSIEDRPWVPQASWPFPAGALDRYLGEALDICGIDPATRRADAAAHAQRLAAWDAVSSDIRPALVHFSRPIRFGTAFHARLASDERIAVYLHATATDLMPAADGSHVAEVSARCLGGPDIRVRADTFVLAGGGIENARLLLAAGRRHGGGLGNAGGMVGRCFMEHPRIATRFRVRPGMTPLGRLVGAGAGAAGTLRFLRVEVSPETQRREQLLAWHANVHFGYAGQDSTAWPSVRRVAIATRTPWRESPYFQDGGGGRTRLRAADLTSIARHPVAGLLGAVGAVAGPPRLRRWIEIIGSVEQIPRAENRIELVDHLDPLGVPRVRIAWGVTKAEERTQRRAMQLLLEALEQVEPGIGDRHMAGDDAWPDDIIGTWHHIGATRMSADARTGVVDGNAMVHGTDNLFVVGSSVFPASGSTSPTVTVIQLALRLGDHLVERLDRSPISPSRSQPVVVGPTADGGNGAVGPVDERIVREQGTP